MSTQHWNAIAGDIPVLTGHERITEGPHAHDNGRDDNRTLQRGWSYGILDPGPAVHLTVEIDRAAAPGTDQLSRMTFGRRTAESVGHILIPLPGIGDDAFAASDNRNTGRPATTVVAATCSGNAYITANVRLPGPINSQDDLAAHTGTLTSLLKEVLAQLRP